jgi:hypothetical protein
MCQVCNATFKPMNFGVRASLLECLDVSSGETRQNHSISFPQMN